MREIAVIKPGNGEHPHGVHEHGQGDSNRAPPDNKNREEGEMEDHKRDRAHPIHLTTISIGSWTRFFVAVDPTFQQTPEA